MQLEIPPGEFDGYIFDCDGTLADTMPAHYVAWQQALRESGAPFEFTEDLFYSLGGVPTPRIVTLLNDKYKTNLNPETVSRHKEELFMQNLHQVTPIEPVVCFARTISQTHPVAVASGGFKRVVNRTLELVGLGGVFPIIVAAEDVEHGKPAPDLFLLAARLMRVAPEKCLVFEDGEAGLQAAAKAGMQTVFISSRR
ncbi:MAG: HAD family phosphatase [Methylacidiphilales bacterium]|nr:HAD family phosphatase [Candidatus Methylacidiphilales bacterium]